MPEIYFVMSRFLIKWIRYFSLQHLPRNDLNSKDGRVAMVERVCKKISCKESSLPVDNPLIEALGYTADTAVMVKLGCWRIQRTYEIDMFKSVMKLYPVLTPAYLLLRKCAVKGSSNTALQIRLVRGLPHTLFPSQL